MEAYVLFFRRSIATPDTETRTDGRRRGDFFHIVVDRLTSYMSSSSSNTAVVEDGSAASGSQTDTGSTRRPPFSATPRLRTPAQPYHDGDRRRRRRLRLRDAHVQRLGRKKHNKNGDDAESTTGDNGNQGQDVLQHPAGLGVRLPQRSC